MSEAFKDLQVELEAPDGGALYAQPEVSGGVLVIALQHENGRPPERLAIDDKKIVKLCSKNPTLQTAVDAAKAIAVKMQVATSMPSADGALAAAMKQAFVDGLKQLGLTPEVVAALQTLQRAEAAAPAAQA
jgi:hypothetical protein